MPLLATTVLVMTLMQAATATPPETTQTTAPPRARLTTILKNWVDKPGERPTRRLWSQSGWVIAVRSDPFTGTVQCQLHRDQLVDDHEISYADGTVGVRHQLQANAANIWFRVDNQPAQPWTSVYRDLMDKGLTVVPYRAGYETDDMLLIPLEQIASGSRLTLRLSGKGKSESFNISGLGEAVEASKRVGCTDGNYVR